MGSRVITFVSKTLHSLRESIIKLRAIGCLSMVISFVYSMGMYCALEDSLTFANRLSSLPSWVVVLTSAFFYVGLGVYFPFDHNRVSKLSSQNPSNELIVKSIIAYLFVILMCMHSYDTIHINVAVSLFFVTTISILLPFALRNVREDLVKSILEV